ncbi:COG3650 family protein [Paracoccus salsus]|uniref:COG3650 family protein n=1 Tax=Paracoccus salsus TaxID=2911061 RepID=UPI001F282311|nr:hypothetical protein [Paracoccus salsus]MCF3972478.1 hypothetical protein [Paracoccus salsus]
MSSRLALIALLTLSVAACEGTGLPGLGQQEEPQAEGHKGPPGVSPLDQPIETGAEARPLSTAEAMTYNTAAFSARGNEPFWAVDAAGSTAIYKTPDNQRGRAVRVSRLAFAEGVEYIGVLNGRPFALTVRGTPCQDSMSGERFPMSAELKVSGRTNRGCAGPASAEVAAAVSATTAPAPAAPRTTRTAAPKPAATRPTAAPVPTSAPAETPAPEAPAVTAPDSTTGPASTAPATGTSAPATDGGMTPLPDLPMRLPSTPPTIPAQPSAPAEAETTDE